jgi:hypothetical protein
MVGRWLLAIALAALTACATRQTAPGVYRVVNTGPARMLVPPGVADPELGKRTFDFPLQKPPGPNCRASAEVVGIEPHRRFLRVRVEREALVAHPAPWLTNWAAGLEERECLSPGEGTRLAQRIVESLPLKPSDVHRLLHGGGGIAGYVDLSDGYRLRLVGPILREGAGPGASALATEEVAGNDRTLSVTVKASADFLGYEISWYAVEGSRIGSAAGESHIGSQVTAEQQPRTNFFRFPEAAAYYRLFFLTRVSQADHNVAVLGAATRGEIERQTLLFNTDTEACRKAPAGMCVALPKEVAVTAYVRVMANGAPLDVPADSNVGGALRAAGIGQPESVLGTLTVRRWFKGALVPVEFDRGKADILMLMLGGNEELRW